MDPWETRPAYHRSADQTSYGGTRNSGTHRPRPRRLASAARKSYIRWIREVLSEAAMGRITVEQVAEAGVVGAGGAGFPTHVKLAAQADTVLINAAECEPLLHKDKEVLRAYADAVLEGLAAAVELVGASAGSSASRRSTRT